MKAGLTKSAIDAFADALLSEDAADAAARLKALAAIFHGLATRPMRDLLDLLDRVTPAGDGATDTSVAAVIGSLRNLELILTKTSTGARLEDLIAFRTKLQRHESGNIETLVKAVQVLRRGKRDEGPVDMNDYMRLAEQLKAALGHDDQFIPLFEQLTKLDTTGVASVANALMSSGTSKSRRRDLDRIRERHNAQRSLLAKQRAMAGRSAA